MPNNIDKELDRNSKVYKAIVAICQCIKDPLCLSCDERVTNAMAEVEALVHSSNKRAEDELKRFAEQTIKDLKQAHAEIVKLQGGNPKENEWPKWTPQANTIRWAEKILASLKSKDRK